MKKFGGQMKKILLQVPFNPILHGPCSGPENFKKSRPKKSWNQINQLFFREIAFPAVLKIFPVQKFTFGHFWNGKKWNRVKKIFKTKLKYLLFTYHRGAGNCSSFPKLPRRKFQIHSKFTIFKFNWIKIKYTQNIYYFPTLRPR